MPVTFAVSVADDPVTAGVVATFGLIENLSLIHIYVYKRQGVLRTCGQHDDS